MTTTHPLPRRTGLVDSARRRFNDLSLPVQILGLGGSGSLASAALVAFAVNESAQAAWAWPLSAGIAAGGLCMSLLGAALASRNTRALHEVSAAAYALRRDDAPDEHDIPLEDCTREMRRTTANLRRMLEAMRRQRVALELRNATLTRRLEDRTHELSTLQDLSIGLATQSDLHGLVDEALGALGQTMDYASASLWARSDREAGGHVVLLGYRTGEDFDLASGEDLTGMRLSRSNLQRYEQIEREHEPLIENHARQSLLSWLWSKVTDDARSSELYRASRSWMALPLKFRDDVLGVMRVDHQDTDYFDPERARLLTAVSSQTALAMRHAKLQSQEREVAVMAERNRIARDLHDAVSQTLFAAKVLAGTLARTAAREPPPSAASVEAQALALERLNQAAVAEMRLLMFELRPDAMRLTPMAELLQHAIEALAGRGIVVSAPRLSSVDSLAPEVRLHLYRIAQEALSNVARHSGATDCAVEWTVHSPTQATLRIADTGNGFEVDLPRPGHFGLENMRSRALEIGARLSLTSTLGQGTELIVELGSEEK